MKNKTDIKHLLSVLVLFFLGSACSKKPDEPILPIDNNTDTVTVANMKLQVPEDNNIYHAAFPDFGGTEDIVFQSRITDFETLAGKEITWAYFSNNWTTGVGIKFPTDAVNTINQLGRVPFIRMEPRSNFDEGGPDPLYTMDNFLSGRFDNDLKQWARDAKATKIPLLVEFGTEVNGDWFPWNATYNGKDETAYGSSSLYDGMEKFRDVYRRIINICNEQGANNITWFYHINVYSSPFGEDWNTIAGYYPGDNYIDWIGISVYGPQSPTDDWQEFTEILSDSWDEILSISTKRKPIAILEWGVVDNGQAQKPEWITNAMNSVKPGGKFYPHIKAVSYWHENFGDTKLRIDSSPESLVAYRQAVNDDIFITKPVIKIK